MKVKLTLSIDRKTIQRAKREAKLKGKSVSRIFEEKMSGDTAVPDKKKMALLRLKKLLAQTKPVKALSKQEEKRRRVEYLKKKYG